MKKNNLLLMILINSFLGATEVLPETPLFKKDKIEISYITTDTVLDTNSSNKFDISYTKNLYNFLNIKANVGFGMLESKYYSSTMTMYGFGTELFYDFNETIYISYSTNIFVNSQSYINNGLEVADSMDIQYDNDIAIYFKSFKYLYNKIYFGISYNKEVGMYYGAAIKYEYIKDLTFGVDMKVLSNNDTDFIFTTGYNF